MSRRNLLLIFLFVLFLITMKTEQISMRMEIDMLYLQCKIEQNVLNEFYLRLYY